MYVRTTNACCEEDCDMEGGVCENASSVHEGALDGRGAGLGGAGATAAAGGADGGAEVPLRYLIIEFGANVPTGLWGSLRTSSACAGASGGVARTEGAVLLDANETAFGGT